VSSAGEWAARLKAFHEKQLDRPRRVYRVGRTKMVVTGGHAASTVGAAVAAVSVDAPDLVFWMAVATGFFGGKYLYPVPRSSVASRFGPKQLTRKSPGELDTMTPEEIQAYQFNMQLAHKGVSPSAFGTEQAIGRQYEAVRRVALANGLDAGLLAHLSLADVEDYGRTIARHNLLKRRWSRYEMDPQLQFDYPEMSNPAFPETASMIRAMRAAQQARTSGDAAGYRLAVDRFSQALEAAERAAGVP
jgi:hypothetical protein